jgi:hypothetical protein
LARASATRQNTDWYHRLITRQEQGQRQRQHQSKSSRSLHSDPPRPTPGQRIMVVTHGDNVWIEPGRLRAHKRPLTIVVVDPGHATRVDAVRSHPEGVHVVPLPIDASHRQKRPGTPSTEETSREQSNTFCTYKCSLAGRLWKTDTQPANATLDVKNGSATDNIQIDPTLVSIQRRYLQHVSSWTYLSSSD